MLKLVQFHFCPLYKRIYVYHSFCPKYEGVFQYSLYDITFLILLVLCAHFHKFRGQCVMLKVCEVLCAFSKVQSTVAVLLQSLICIVERLLYFVVSVLGNCAFRLVFVDLVYLVAELFRSGVSSGVCVVIGRTPKLRVWYLLCFYADLTSALVSESIEVSGQTNLKCTWWFSVSDFVVLENYRSDIC
ncbi:hypothetical protein Hdeb2414_s0016g00474321 [Helianthus debilis subsp. tardiflorus]